MCGSITNYNPDTYKFEILIAAVLFQKVECAELNAS